MIQNCSEQILEDVVRVDLVKASLCDLPIPFNIKVQEMAGTKVVDGQTVDRIGAASLSLAYSVQDGDDGEIDSTPVLKQSEKRQTAGIVVTHDLQVPVTAGFQATRTAVAEMQEEDFHVVLTTGEGERYLCYALPNTSQVALDEQGVNQQMTVKITVQSVSHVVRLT